MKTSSNGLSFIAQQEGCILHTYNDGTGVLTIGVGHTSAAGPPKVQRGQTITKEQAYQILATDLGKVEAQVNTLVRVPINQNQFDALVSFHFNTGALGRSTALKKLNQGDYNGAADALLAYNRAGGRVLPGLSKRRALERQMFLSKVPQVPQVPSGSPTAVSVGLGGILAASFHSHPWYWFVGGALVAGLVIEFIYYKSRGK